MSMKCRRRGFRKWVALVAVLAMVFTTLGSSTLGTVQAAAAYSLTHAKKTLYLNDDNVTGLKSVCDLGIKNKPAGWRNTWKVTWVSSNKEVAVVKTGGVVNAKSVGTAKVTAKITNKKTGKKIADLSCAVTVKANAETVQIVNVPSDQVMLIGSSYDFNHSKKAASGSKTTDLTKWVLSDNTAGAKLGANAVVTVSKAGTFTLTAKTFQSRTALKKYGDKAYTAVSNTVKVTVPENLVLGSSDVKDGRINVASGKYGDIIIQSGVGSAEITLDNAAVYGTLKMAEGADYSVILKNSKVASAQILSKMDTADAGMVYAMAESASSSKVPSLYVRGSSTVDSILAQYGIKVVQDITASVRAITAKPQNKEEVQISLDGFKGELVVESDVKDSSVKVEAANCEMKSAAVRGKAENQKVELSDKSGSTASKITSLTLETKAEVKVDVAAGTVVLKKEAKSSEISLEKAVAMLESEADNAKLVVNGTVESMSTSGASTEVAGKGTIKEAVVSGNNTKLDVTVDKVEVAGDTKVTDGSGKDVSTGGSTEGTAPPSGGGSVTPPVQTSVTGVTVTGSVSFTTSDTAAASGKAITAAVAPDTAANKQVKWTMAGTDAGKFALYTDEAGTAAVATGTAVSNLTVYVKAADTLTKGQTATVTVTTVDGNKTAGCSITVTAPPIAGTVAITGAAAVGRTLTASTAGVTSGTPGAFGYQWYADGTAIAGAAGSTYVLTTAECGKTITLEVTAANYSGKLVSPATEAVKNNVATVSSAKLSVGTEVIGSGSGDGAMTIEFATTKAVDVKNALTLTDPNAKMKIVAAASASAITDKTSFDSSTEKAGEDTLASGDVLAVLAEDELTIKKYTFSATKVAVAVDVTGSNKEVTYTEETIAVNGLGLFTISPESDGVKTYTVTGITGAGTMDASGSALTVTSAGALTVKLSIAGTADFAAASGTAVLTINKAEGKVFDNTAAVSLAAVGIDTVTLAAVTSNAITAQAVEYASGTSAAAPVNGWQDGLTFTGLTGNTKYYFFARTKENALYKAGTPISAEGTTLKAPDPSTAAFAIAEEADFKDGAYFGITDKATIAAITANVTAAEAGKTVTFSGYLPYVRGMVGYWPGSGNDAVAKQKGNYVAFSVKAASGTTISFKALNSEEQKEVTIGDKGTEEFLVRLDSTVAASGMALTVKNPGNYANTIYNLDFSTLKLMEETSSLVIIEKPDFSSATEGSLLYAGAFKGQPGIELKASTDSAVKYTLTGIVPYTHDFKEYWDDGIHCNGHFIAFRIRTATNTATATSSFISYNLSSEGTVNKGAALDTEDSESNTYYADYIFRVDPWKLPESKNITISIDLDGAGSTYAATEYTIDISGLQLEDAAAALFKDGAVFAGAETATVKYVGEVTEASVTYRRYSIYSDAAKTNQLHLCTEKMKQFVVVSPDGIVTIISNGVDGWEVGSDSNNNSHTDTNIDNLNINKTKFSSSNEAGSSYTYFLKTTDETPKVYKWTLDGTETADSIAE